MNLVLIGATGYVGGFVLKEALDRGHTITAVSRHIEKLIPHPNQKAANCDIFNEDELAAIISGA